MATIDGVKAKLQGLIDTANATTGKADTDLTSAMDSMVTKIENGIGDAMNIAYGDNPPEDTSKLWVKTDEPSGVIVSADIAEEESGEMSFDKLAEILPQGISATGCATVGNYIYILGGSNGSDYLKTIYKFNTTTETIETLSTQLPTWLGNMACVAIGSKIYLLGGMNAISAQNKIYCFDTETETVSTLSSTLPTNLYAMGYAAIDTKIYLFGGVDSSYTDTIYCYDTEANTTKTMGAKLSGGTYGANCAAVGGKIYILGGYQLWGAISCYDPYKDTINTLTPKLSHVYDGACAAVETKIYLFCGQNVYCFDTETETLTTLPQTFLESLSSMGCAVYENKIYIFGGQSSSVRKNTIYRFTTVGKVKLLPENQLQIIPVLYNTFLLIDTDTVKAEIGAHEVYKGNADGHAEKVEAALYKNGAWKTI